MPPFHTPPGHAKTSTSSTTWITQGTTATSSPVLTVSVPLSVALTSSTNASPNSCGALPLENSSQQADAVTGQVIASGRGRFTFSLPDNDVRDWALVNRHGRADFVVSCGLEDRIGVLGAKRVSVTGRPGKVKVRDHRDRLVAVIRDPDITLAQARDMVIALPQGWPV